MRWNRIALVAVALSGVASTSCMPDEACVKSAADRATAVVLVDDASARLDEAEAVVVKIGNADIRDKAVAALGLARAQLDAVRHALAGIQGACEGVSIHAVFAEFVAAWKALAPFLALLGGPSAGSQVQAPIVVEMPQ